MKRSWFWGLRDQCGVCDFYHLDLDEVTWGCGGAAIIRHQDLESRRKNRRLWTLFGELIKTLAWAVKMSQWVKTLTNLTT